MSRRDHGLIPVAAALVLGGAVLVAASVGGCVDPTLRVAGADRPVNDGAGDLADIRAHNSPSVARDPRDPEVLVVSSRIDSPRFSCALHVSDDGGARWDRTRVPIPPGEERKCYAPDVAFAADGTLLVSYVTLRGVGNVPNAVWVARSRDGGRSIEPPVRVSGPKAFQVRIAPDPARAGRVYLTWLQARSLGSLRFSSVDNPIVLARSDDGGRTWSAPRRVSAPARPRVLAASPAVGKRGEVYALYVDVRDDRLDYEGGHEGFGGPPYDGRFELVLARSRDGGRRWEESVVDRAVAPIERFVPFLPAFPAIAVDREDGRVYAGYHDRRDGDADVLVWALDPGAARWRGPARVNGERRGDRTSQYLPQLGVAPGGRLDVAYFDRSGDRANVRNHVALQSSFDDGRSFSARLRLSRTAFDARIGFGSERGMPDLGSRLALLSDAHGALAVWPDTRSGTDASNKQDLLSNRVSVSDGGPAGTLRDGGIALATGGLAALALAVLRRRRGGTPR